ncbi:hypothetical protein QBC35DRAFT_250885 [Podospora australis]|uniref:GPI anchored protein n=1 Tax=Podospora australis TaxID=1536484 RepID=A0AAN6WRT9_9PEZI|nr:hypothetical protein QBC35DRAFT_250885 [Podospora australis]
MVGRSRFLAAVIAVVGLSGVLGQVSAFHQHYHQLRRADGTGDGFGWKGVECNDSLAYERFEKTAEQRWTRLKADELWKYIVDKWGEERPKNETSFTWFLQKTTRAPYLTRCSQGFTISCSAPGKPCGSNLPTPAVWLLDTVFWNIAAMQDFSEEAKTVSLPSLKSFAEKFVTVQRPVNMNHMLSSFLNSSGGALEATNLRNMFFGENNSTEYMTSHKNTLRSVREFSALAQTRFQNGPYGENFTFDRVYENPLAMFRNTWLIYTTPATIAEAFKGEEEGVDYFTAVIGNGELLDLEFPTRTETNRMVDRVMYTFVIPYLWRLQDLQPVLVSTGWDCGQPQKSAVIDRGMNDKDNNAEAEACIDGKLYYLQDASSKGTKLSLLPGTSSLGAAMLDKDGQMMDQDAEPSTYAGVRVHNLARAILARHRKMGNTFLDGKLPDTEEGKKSMTELWDEIIDGGANEKALLPGVVNVPTCDLETVERNQGRRKAGHQLDMAEFPCNAPDSGSMAVTLRSNHGWYGVLTAVFAVLVALV